MMMDKLREGAQGRTAKVIFSLIILSFALAGVGSYLNRPTDNAVAHINGDPIAPQELESALRNEQARLEAQLGEAFQQMAQNPEYMAQLRQSVLDRLIDQALIDEAARKLGLRVGDAEIKQAILTMPEFQNNGKFDNDRYLRLIRNAGMTPEIFGETLRRDMVRQQLLTALLSSEFTLPAQSALMDQLLQQTRDLRLVRFAAKDYLSKVKIDDTAIQAYYDSNSSQFMSDERVKVDYILLDAAKMPVGDVSDADLQSYYDQHPEQFQRPEQRRVAHILIPNSDAKAKEKAEAILKRLQAGEDFAKVAQKESADTLSAKRGGELDWFEKGVMDPAFEDAAFALKKSGELSAIVKSNFGLHIIQLLEVKPAVQSPFDEVKAETKQRLQQEKAKELFFAEQQKMADSSFENPDSLDVTAQTLGLNIESTPLFTQADAPAPLNDPKVLDAAFSATLREEATNSDVIEIGDGKALVLRIAEHQPRAPKPLAEVKSVIVKALEQQEAGKLARLDAEQLLNQLQNGGDAKGLKIETVNAANRYDAKLDRALLQEVFKMAHPQTDKPTLALVAQGNGDQVVVALDKVNNSTKPSAMAAMLESQLAQSQSESTYRALIGALRGEAEIEYSKLNKAATE